MNKVFVSREFNDPGFSLAIVVCLPEKNGECEWRSDYKIDFNESTEVGYSIGIDGLDAIVNAISEVRRACSRLSAESPSRSWHLLPYISPTIDQAFDEYIEALVVSARDFYWKNKEPPPLPNWDADSASHEMDGR